MTLEEAAALGCCACVTPGGDCQFLGTAAFSQVVAEALGLAAPHSALAPSGQAVWRENAVRSARAALQQEEVGLTGRDILTAVSVRNAVVVHAAFGGNANLLLHIPVIAQSVEINHSRVLKEAS